MTSYLPRSDDVSKLLSLLRDFVVLPSLNRVKYVQNLCAVNFEIVAVSRPCIRFFLFRYHFEALTK